MSKHLSFTAPTSVFLIVLCSSECSASNYMTTSYTNTIDWWLHLALLPFMTRIITAIRSHDSWSWSRALFSVFTRIVFFLKNFPFWYSSILTHPVELELRGLGLLRNYSSPFSTINTPYKQVGQGTKHPPAQHKLNTVNHSQCNALMRFNLTFFKPIHTQALCMRGRYIKQQMTMIHEI